MSLIAQPYQVGIQYLAGNQITNAVGTGFHVCLANHVSGKIGPIPGESTRYWHWSTDFTLLK